MSSISNYFSYHKKLFLLATPIILSNIGQVIVTLADTMMVGQIGQEELAIVSFSGMIIMTFIVFGMGFSVGLTPLVAKKIIIGKRDICKRLFSNSLFLNTIIGVLLALCLFAIYPLFNYLGQPQNVIDGMWGYYAITALSIIPYMIFLTFKQFLEGIGNTFVSMTISIFCNILNIGLNYLFIFGEFGFPEWGVFGAGFATFISRLSMPILFYLYQKFSRYKSFVPQITFKLLDKRFQKLLFLFGTPISIQMVIEFMALAVITVMMGWLGVMELAANQIAYSIMSIMYFIVCGVAFSVTIMVSFENGMKRVDEIKRYVISGLQLSVGLMVVSAIIMITLGMEIALLFTNDIKVAALAASYMIAVGAVQVFDGIQITLLGALRGIGDVNAPMKYSLVLYGVICIAIAYICGFILDFAGVGVWLGFASGLFLASFVYGKRLINQLKKMF